MTFPFAMFAYPLLRKSLQYCAAGGFALAVVAGSASHAGEMLARARHLQQIVANQYGVGTDERLTHWREMVSAGADETDAVKLHRVNLFFNRIPYLSDMRNWGTPDYWATPTEMLTVNGGDCEDYAIAKFFSLLEMGIAAERLRVWYTSAVDRSEKHMVLAYYPDAAATPLILDNLTDEIQPATRRPDLVPVYSFNENGLWAARGDGRDEKIGRPERLAQWFEMLVRMNREIRRRDLVATATARSAAHAGSD